MTMTLSLLVPQELCVALRGTIPTVPIWLLTTTLYSWVVSTITAIDTTGSGSVSSGSVGDDHANMSVDGDDQEGVECAASGQEEDAMALELVRKKSTSIQNVDFQTVHDEADNGGASEDDKKLEYNGLQIWLNGMITREDSCDDLFVIASL